MMQQAIKVHTLVNQAVVDVIPALQPLLGHQVQMIALDLEPSFSSKSAPTHQPEPLATPDVSDTEMESSREEIWRRLLALREQAIAEGMRLMDWDEVNADVQNRRGGV